MIQPPIMKLLTTEKERSVKMEQTRTVTKTEKILFPIIVSAVVILLLPSTAPLIGCLMLGNLWRETGLTDRLSDTAQNALMNIVTIFLGISVGATTVADRFLTLETIKIVVLGLTAFAFSTIGGLLVGKIMYKYNAITTTTTLMPPPVAIIISRFVSGEVSPPNWENIAVSRDNMDTNAEDNIIIFVVVIIGLLYLRYLIKSTTARIVL